MMETSPQATAAMPPATWRLATSVQVEGSEGQLTLVHPVLEEPLQTLQIQPVFRFVEIASFTPQKIVMMGTQPQEMVVMRLEM